MKLCRNCEFWESIPESWQGNCTLHPWDKPKWSETAEPSSNSACHGMDFKDKYEKYQMNAGGVK